MPTLDRRTLLRGLGAAVALPLLDAMIPVRAKADATAPRRLVTWCLVNGRVPEHWKPTTTGVGYVAPRCLEPLAPVRSRVRVLTNLDTPAPRLPNDPHQWEARAAISSCDLEANTFGTSVDVEIAARSTSTPFPMLALASESGPNCTSLGCTYGLSYGANGVELVRDREPAAVFERLFGVVGRPRSLVERRRGASLLDAVRADASSLRSRLGASDRVRVDEHLDGIREIERRLAFPSSPDCGGDWLAAPPTSPAEHIAQMTELIVLALSCDLTRVVTYMPAIPGSDRFLPEIATQGHHVASHIDPDEAATYMRWYVDHYARLVARLEGVVGADDRTLLDDTFVLGIGGYGDGANHTFEDVPVLLAGDGGDAPDLQGHVAFPVGTSTALLHRSLLAHFGADQTWGTLGTGYLPGFGG